MPLSIFPLMILVIGMRITWVIKDVFFVLIGPNYLALIENKDVILHIPAKESTDSEK